MIKGITHIALNVKDMEKSVRFYCGALGFKAAFDICNDKGEPWIKYIKAGAGQFIELFYNGTEEFGKGSFAHLCFEVDDINGIAEQIKAGGAPLTSEPRQGRDRNWQCWTKDPDGNPIELMQLSPESPQMKAIKELQ